MNKLSAILKGKSKTVNFSVLYTSLIVIATRGLGYNIPPEAAAAGATLLGIVFRWITNTSLEDK